MRHTRCLYSPARALRRVFLSDLTTTTTATTGAAASSYNGGILQPVSASLLLSTQHPTLRISGGVATKQHQHQQQIRTYKGGKPSDSSPPVKRYLMNEQIPGEWVQVVSPEPGAPLPPPERLRDVLQSLDLTTHALTMVAPPQVPPVSEEEQARMAADPYYRPPPVSPTPAVCKVADLAAMAAAEAAAQLAARQRRLGTKELEFGWAIAPNDLEHKLRRMRAFLRSGLRVEVLIARKKGARQASAAEAAALVESIYAAVAEVPKANEARKPNGEVGGVLKLVFQGPAGKKKGKGKKNKNKGEEEEEEEDEEEEGGEEEGEAEGEEGEGDESRR